MTEQRHPDPNTTKADLQKRDRAEFLAVREKHVEILKSECSAYDKAVLQLSAAAIGVSIVFLGNISKKPPAKVCWLALAWIFLIGSMAVMIFGFLFSHFKLNREIEDLQREQEGLPPLKDLPRFLKPKYFNAASGTSLILGIVCLAVFAIVNLY
jgi:hypothetical protein